MSPTPSLQHPISGTTIPHGKLLLNGSLRDLETGENIGFDADVLYGISPDGSQVLGARAVREPTGITREFELVLYDANTGASSVIRHTGAREDLGPAAWSPDGHTVAYRLSVYREDPSIAHPGPNPEMQTVCVIEVRTAKDRCLPESGAVFSFDWSPDGATLLLAGSRVRLLDIATGRSSMILPSHGSSSIRRALQLAGHGRPVQFVIPVWSPSGRYMAAMVSTLGGHAGNVPVILRPNGRFVAMGRPSTDSALIAWSPVEDVLAYTTARPSYRTTGLLLLDALTGESHELLQFGKNAQVTDLVWSPGGRWLAISPWAGSYGEFRIVMVDSRGDAESEEFSINSGGASEPLVDWGV